MSEDDKELPEEIIKSEKPAGRFRGRWNEGFNSRDEVLRPLAPKGGGKAEEEHVYRPNDISKIEIFRARGFAKVAGRHVMADGLVSRAGYRRIPPGWLTDDSGLWDDRAQQLTDIAHRELRGRNLEIFERLILGPLNGAERPSISDLAEQYSVPVDRIYRITNDCKVRVMTAFVEHGSITELAPAREGFGPREIMAMILQAEQEIFDEMVLYHKIVRRSAAVEELLTEADAIWAAPAREYVCRTTLLNGYLDRLKALIAAANDPTLANPNALHVIGGALKANLPSCLSTCPCGGYGPRLPWDE